MDERAHKLIECVYDAVEHPEIWSDVVAGVSDIFEGSPVMLDFFTPGEPVANAHFSTGLREDALPRYSEYLRRDHGYSCEAMHRFKESFVSMSVALTPGEVEETDLYNDWMEPQGLAPLWPVGHAITIEEGQVAGFFSVFRVTGKNSFTEQMCSEADLFIPHFRRAVQVNTTLNSEQQARAALAEVMDRLPTGMLLLDRYRHVVLQNRAAEAITAFNDGFYVDQGGPSVENARENASLQTLIADAMDAGERGSFAVRGFLSITRASGKRPLSVMVTPLHGTPHRAPPGVAVLALFVSDPEMARISGPKALEALYSLTHSEVEIVRLLSMGMSLEEAAAERGVSMNTARSHVKHMFAKVGVSRQGELVRMILSGLGPIRDG